MPSFDILPATLLSEIRRPCISSKLASSYDETSAFAETVIDPEFSTPPEVISRYLILFRNIVNFCF